MKNKKMNTLSEETPLIRPTESEPAYRVHNDEFDIEKQDLGTQDLSGSKIFTMDPDLYQELKEERNKKSAKTTKEMKRMSSASLPATGQVNNESVYSLSPSTLKVNANARIAKRAVALDEDPDSFHHHFHDIYQEQLLSSKDRGLNRISSFDEMHHRCLHKSRSIGDQWKIDIEPYLEKLQNVDSKAFKKQKREVRQFYIQQNQIVSSYLEAEKRFGDIGGGVIEHVDESSKDRIATSASNIVNILLTVAKVAAVFFSGSMSIVSSLVDSAVDLFTGLLLWFTAVRVQNTNHLLYPIGRQQLEPVAIVVCSAVMATASLQIIAQSAKDLINQQYDINVDMITLIIMCSTILLKIILYFYCKRLSSSTAQTLALDHFNDVLSNSGALLFAFLASKYWKPLDSIGAILIALLIIYSWCKTGYEEVKGLSGHSAEPMFLNTLTWIARNHHPDVLAVETVSAYHFGSKMICEVDIVLCPFTSLPVAHDIAETLQMKLEDLDEIERAFVHIDFELYHERRMEHVRGH